MGFFENMKNALGQPQPVADATSGWAKPKEERALGDNIYDAIARNTGNVPDPTDWMKKK